jgi:hypothetical protein
MMPRQTAGVFGMCTGDWQLLGRHGEPAVGQLVEHDLPPLPPSPPPLAGEGRAGTTRTAYGKERTGRHAAVPDQIAG